MKKNIIILNLLILLLGLFVCSRKSDVPSYLNEHQDAFRKNPRIANLNWFKEAEFGLFIHYGLYSLLEKGEWVQVRDTIPVSDYSKLKEKFTASKFNADKITDIAMSAGMKYITITSKHHDGFCLFNTKETDYNSLNSPAKRDLIKELYDACEQKGLGLFLYYSYAADWYHPYFYPRELGWYEFRPAYTEPQSEYKFKKHEDFQKYINYVHNQLYEILTQYPNIAGIWFDPILGYYHKPDIFPIDSTYALIRKLSPHALISFKHGANGDEDFVAPERTGKERRGSSLEISNLIYQKNQTKFKEICNTLQPRAWGYNKADDGKHRNADDVMDMLKNAQTMNANLLLNVGPEGDGAFPEEDISTLYEVGLRRKIKK